MNIILKNTMDNATMKELIKGKKMRTKINKPKINTFWGL
jgi:hypothetical protein